MGKKMELKPCKHLDYDENKHGPYVELRDCSPHYPLVRYWLSGDLWTDAGSGVAPNPAKVQFCCSGRGRINGIFQCYNGEMHCYESEIVHWEEEK